MQPNAGLASEHPLVGKRILIAEDEDRLRSIVAMMIEELGGETVTVADGAGAVKVYGQNRGKFDAVLVDIKMKGISGIAAFEQILGFDPSARIVLCSGVLPDDPVLESIRNHGCAFLEKPFNVKQLGEVLCSVMNDAPKAAP